MDVQTIQKTLYSDGYVLIQDPVPFLTFRDICLGLGKIISENSVKIRKDIGPLEKKYYIDSDIPAPFHTDGLDTDYVAWYCVDPGFENEETLLLNVNLLLSHFTEDEKLKLTNVNFYNLNAGVFPILRCENPLDFYFVPSQIDQSKKIGSNLELLKKIFILIDKLSKDQSVRIRYQPNQCLFLNNKTFLHGRPQLSSQTTRHLERVWIRKIG